MNTRLMMGAAVLVFAAGAAFGVAMQDGAKPGGTSADDAAKKQAEEVGKKYAQYATPGAEHARLAKRAGTWNVVTKIWSAPGAEPDTYKSTSQFTVELDNRFVTERIEGNEELAGKYKSFAIWGYNNGTKRFEYSWVDTMGTGIVRGVGVANNKGDIAWNAEMFDASIGKIIKMREVETTKPDGSFVRETFATGADNKESKVMEMTYTKRTK